MTAADVIAPETLVTYDDDVLLWSQQQARLLREGRFALLDVEHLADEIEDVGKSERRELASRCAVLLAHLLKWRLQPDLRSNSWKSTILEQRRRVALAIKMTPSLKTTMRDADWREDVWLEARAHVRSDTGLPNEAIPTNPFKIEQALETDFWPA